MTVAERLELVDELRKRGATMIELEGMRVIFGPVPRPDDVPDAAKPELEERRRRSRDGRSIDEKLFGALGIVKEAKGGG